jgi:hypothetical protein
MKCMITWCKIQLALTGLYKCYNHKEQWHQTIRDKILFQRIKHNWKKMIIQANNGIDMDVIKKYLNVKSSKRFYQKMLSKPQNLLCYQNMLSMLIMMSGGK